MHIFEIRIVIDRVLVVGLLEQLFDEGCALGDLLPNSGTPVGIYSKKRCTLNKHKKVSFFLFFVFFFLKAHLVSVKEEPASQKQFVAAALLGNLNMCVSVC